MSMRALAKLMVGSVLTITLGSASAGIVKVTDRSIFNTMGTIVENYGFDDLSTSDFTSLPNNWVAHGVQYTTASNLVGCASCGYGGTSNWFAYNGWTPVVGNIVLSDTDMFGFDLASAGRTDPIDITIITNLGSYSFLDQVAPNLFDGMQFFGFVASAGELITSFSMNSNGGGAAPVLDNVTLGHAIPEPTSVALAALGLFGLAAGARRKSR